MRNIKELREELGKVYEGLRDGDLDTKRAAEMNNTAGKIMMTVITELKYFDLRKETPEIDFMNYGQTALPGVLEIEDQKPPKAKKGA